MTQNARAHAYEIPSWAIAMTLYGGASRREEKVMVFIAFCGCGWSDFPRKRRDKALSDARYHLDSVQIGPHGFTDHAIQIIEQGATS